MQVRSAICLLSLLSLAGCDGPKSLLIASRRVPDEFEVVQRASLEIPPDFTLRPPMPGAPPKHYMEASHEAKNVVYDSVVRTKKARPAGRARAVDTFLSQARAEERDPVIRQTIIQETHDASEGDENFMRKLAFWKKKQKKGDVIDPIAEKARFAAPSNIGD